MTCGKANGENGFTRVDDLSKELRREGKGANVIKHQFDDRDNFLR